MRAGVLAGVFLDEKNKPIDDVPDDDADERPDEQDGTLSMFIS